MPAPAAYQHEVRYARWWAYLILITGLIGLPTAAICALWLRSWGLPLALAGGSLLALTTAFQRLSDSGPQLKFGAEGIWTAKLGFQPWRKVRAEVGRPPGTTHGSMMGYVLVYDRQTGALLDQLDAGPLDMEVDVLGGNLRYHSRQNAR
ncbi:hypothetical protein EJV47_26710 [Hymenobacter gummosus]|uniref:PH domain-containing protein n=1 Tax=Hymenobacter gummosus TaxID=1776032 RepID=A0A3S0H0P1_9BACT|nr:hypothetical protein [Hymenobacter gummosus]RTQ44963.1 hypothetical protein EJV47_26710 [Hymenobacter gummosus]